MDVVFALVVAAVFVVPLLILGLVALVRARPEDIPAVVRALARWGRKLGRATYSDGDLAPAGSLRVLAVKCARLTANVLAALYGFPASE